MVDIRLNGVMKTLPGALSVEELVDQLGYVIKMPLMDFDQAIARVRAAARDHARFWIVGQSQKSFASDADVEARVLAWMDRAFDRAADLGALTADDPGIRLYSVRPSAPGPAR